MTKESKEGDIRSMTTQELEEFLTGRDRQSFFFQKL